MSGAETKTIASDAQATARRREKSIETDKGERVMGNVSENGLRLGIRERKGRKGRMAANPAPKSSPANSCIHHVTGKTMGFSRFRSNRCFSPKGLKSKGLKCPARHRSMWFSGDCPAPTTRHGAKNSAFQRGSLAPDSHVAQRRIAERAAGAGSPWFGERINSGARLPSAMSLNRSTWALRALCASG